MQHSKLLKGMAALSLVLLTGIYSCNDKASDKAAKTDSVTTTTTNMTTAPVTTTTTMKTDSIPDTTNHKTEQTPPPKN